MNERLIAREKNPVQHVSTESLPQGQNIRISEDTVWLTFMSKTARCCQGIALSPAEGQNEVGPREVNFPDFSISVKIHFNSFSQ